MSLTKPTRSAGGRQPAAARAPSIDPGELEKGRENTEVVEPIAWDVFTGEGHRDASEGPLSLDLLWAMPILQDPFH